MPGSSAAQSDDDILAAYSKPADGSAAAAPAPVSADDAFLQAYSKPAPAAAAPEAPPISAAAYVLPQVTGALNDAARASNAAIARTLAPVQIGTSELGPNATAADIPPDSPAGQLRMGVTLAAPLQDIDPEATFNALSARRNALLADGKDPKQDPEYRNLLQLQAKAFAQNNQQGAMFLAPGGALEGGVAGIVSRGANRLIESLPENRISGPAGAPSAAPAAPTGAPVPQDLGAAASAASDTAISPQDVARYQASAEGRKLLETQTPGVADTTAYVPGVNATTAEIEQTVNASREAKLANLASPDLSQTDREIAEANSEHRKDYFEAVSGDPVSTGILRDDRSAQATADINAAFSGEKAPADTAPISTAISDSLSTPRGRQNADLQGYLQPLLDRLQTPEGAPKITDPEELYGFREQVAKMLSKASQRKDPGLEHVAGQIGDLLPVIDQQIEAAAPGYRQYMDNYAAASRKIDEQTVLQDHLPKLFDAQNHMTYNKVQTMMRQVVDARGAQGLNPYKSISDDTMGNLWNLRDDLRRSASARELARSPGSDTAQNLFDLAKDAGRGAVRLGIHGAAQAVLPVAGPLIVNAADRLLSARSANRLQAQATARGHQNLRPNRLVPRED